MNPRLRVPLQIPLNWRVDRRQDRAIQTSQVPSSDRRRMHLRPKRINDVWTNYSASFATTRKVASFRQHPCRATAPRMQASLRPPTSTIPHRGRRSTSTALRSKHSAQDSAQLRPPKKQRLDSVAVRLQKHAAIMYGLSKDPAMSGYERSAAAKIGDRLKAEQEATAEQGRKIVPRPLRAIPEPVRNAIAADPWSLVEDKVTGNSAKVLKPAMKGLPYFSTGVTIIDKVSDVASGSKSWQRATAEGVGGILGGIGGGMIGRPVGAAIGTAAEAGIPGPGTVVGAVAGDIAVSAVGSHYGEKAGDWLADEQHWR